MGTAPHHAPPTPHLLLLPGQRSPAAGYRGCPARIRRSYPTTEAVLRLQLLDDLDHLHQHCVLRDHGHGDHLQEEEEEDGGGALHCHGRHLPLPEGGAGGPQGGQGGVRGAGGEGEGRQGERGGGGEGGQVPALLADHHHHLHHHLLHRHLLHRLHSLHP